MAKITQREVLNILRFYEIATPADVPRLVENLKVIALTQSITASCQFKGYSFFLLWDDNITDTASEVEQTLNIAYPGVNLKAVPNPKDSDHSFGMPYKAKAVYLATINEERQRLDVVLAKAYPDLSRSTIQKYIKAGASEVDGVVQTAPKALVHPTSKVVLNIPKVSEHKEKTLPILYEDKNVLVINKPAGVLTHSKGALNDEFTVETFLSRYYDSSLTGDRPGIVHRLDRDTSGVIIGAKNANAAKLLRRQFAERKAKKTYHAVLDGQPKETKAVLELPIARNMNKPSTFKVDAQGKPATTQYEVISILPNQQTLVKFTPITGRTHQLRVHSQYLNTPIVGDIVYGKKKRKEHERMLLHASELEVTIPGGVRKKFKAPLPKQFNVEAAKALS